MKELAEQKMLAANLLIANAVPVICDLQINGVQIDQEFVTETIPKMEALVAGYQKNLEVLAGGVYDWNSPKELDKLLYDVMKYPRPAYSFKDTATDEEALSVLNTPLTQELIKHRKASKLLGTYFQGYFSKVGADGRLRAEYNLHGTRTGRLSSDTPNLQNLSRGLSKDDIGYEDFGAFKVKNAIVARPGWVLVSADQSQVELRVSAMVSKDPDLMSVYLNKLDMHSANAIVSFSIDVPLEQKEGEDDIAFILRQHQWVKENKDSERTAAKSVSFGILYGMGAMGLRFDLDSKTRAKGKLWTKEECQTLIDNFNDKYTALTQWIKRTRSKAEKTGYAETLFGRRRPLPELKHSEWYERQKGLRMSVNTPIQGSASDILILGLINLRERMDHTRAKIVMTVHDSIVLEVREDYVQELIPIVKDCMENPLFQGKPLPFLNIPLLAEFEIGPKYGMLKKVK